MRFRMLWILFIVAGLASPAAAQSQAINGNIEGIVRDTSGAVLPGVTVTVTNTETGLQRALVTDENGAYRAALLPLGTYAVKAELQGFRASERTGVSLSAGQIATVNFDLAVGAVQEVVEVSADAAITQPARIDLGRTISSVEVKNLPNVSRNTFNFALLQPNVTGYENEEFGATRMNANGSQMRTNYQIDGGSATQKNRAGLRMFQPSDIMVEEVQVITSGFAPEFGQTTGMVYNAVTPSGTNQFHGQGSYRFRRKAFSARPFTLAASAPKPDTKVDNYTVALGGPIKRDRAQFYFGYEFLRNDLSAGRVITVTPATAQTLGLSATALGDGVIPAVQSVNMLIAKTDVSLNQANRLSARWSLFKNSTPENVGGGLNTRETATDFEDRMDSVGLQLVSTVADNKLNELRIAYGRRDNPRVPSSVAGPGPAVSISGVANFGGSATRTTFLEDYWQVVNNFTWFVGNHSLKAGIDFQFINDERLDSVQGSYTFPNVASYLAARNGTNPFGYTRFTQNVGDPSVQYSQSYYSFFLQDDYRISPRFKVLYGVRYDLFKVPDGDPNAPYAASQHFRVDKNNLAPRVGIAWSLDDQSRTVVRASTGMMYETPLGAFYEDALLENGSPKLLSANVSPGQVGAPAFPGLLSSLPPGVTPSNSIRAVDPNFDSQWALLTNVQLEHALSGDASLSVGYVNSTGRNLPVLLNSNVIATGATLADGRPIYASSVNAATRLDPRFNTINLVRSTGTSQYNALTVSLNRRWAGGLQAQASYTLARAEDDGVIGGRYVVGSSDRPGLSDPSDQTRDYSYTSWNTTHTFIASAVINPHVEGTGIGAMLANDNQFSVILQANSGLPFNIRSNRDLNLDGISADRPVGVARNSGTLGRVFNVDLRYSRFFRFLRASQRAEFFLEAKNLFNTASVRGVNSVVATDTLGNPLATIPSGPCEIGATSTSGCFAVTSAYQQRQMQMGFKFIF
ncbi:MAG: carboxypeptidase regulatory-like domain-containing protein [Vicinamibacterales bacterium]